MIIDKNGNIFRCFELADSEESLSALTQSVSVSLVLAKDEIARYVLIQNTFRNQWEIPGGFVDAGETPKQAAMREMYEETGVELDQCSLSGIMYFYSKERKMEEIATVYEATTSGIEGFKPNAEAGDIFLWDVKEPFPGYLNELDAELIRLNFYT